jgi:hypothetical protein
MRKPPATGRETKAWNKGAANSKASATANETDPLLSQSSASSYSRTAASSNIRSRRASGSRSPLTTTNQHFGSIENDMNTTHGADSLDKEIQQSYNILQDEVAPSGNRSVGGDGSQSGASSHSGASRSVHQLRRHYVARGSGEHPPLLEIPEEIYNVRKSALSVLKPLTRTWVSR